MRNKQTKTKQNKTKQNKNTNRTIKQTNKTKPKQNKRRSSAHFVTFPPYIFNFPPSLLQFFFFSSQFSPLFPFFLASCPLPHSPVTPLTNTVPLIHLVRHRQLKFLSHILRISKEESARRYGLYIPTICKKRPGRPVTSYFTYVQRLLGDNEGAMQEQQIAALADDRRAWRNLVVACSAADGWWWWWWWWLCIWYLFEK